MHHLTRSADFLTLWEAGSLGGCRKEIITACILEQSVFIELSKLLPLSWDWEFDVDESLTPLDSI